MADKFVENLVHFARVLRRAGLTVGPDRVLQAIEVLPLVGIEHREDVRSAMACALIDSHEHRALFDAAFDTFWQDPGLLEKLLLQALPDAGGEPAEIRKSQQQRLAAAMQPSPRDDDLPAPDPQSATMDASRGASATERLRQADFESMSPGEFQAAKTLAETIELPLPTYRSRRHRPATRGRIDLRQTLRQMTRTPAVLNARFSAPLRKTPDLVLLIDISGSMERYARLFLHFAHGLTRRNPRTQTFAFGTRLTPLTRALRFRDPDEATAMAASQIADWNSGTRIASALAQFNQRWARRLLTGHTAVLLVTDGLDRDRSGELGRQAALLSRFAAHLIWLNPLLRFDGFEPRAGGIRALLPHVDHFLPMHNIESLEALGSALSRATAVNGSEHPVGRRKLT